MNSDFIPPLHPDFHYSVEHVGIEKQPVLIVDNFLDKAEVLIEIAERYCQFGSSTYLYTGLQSLVPQFYTLAIYTYLREIISKTFSLDSSNITRSKSFFL